MYVIMYVSDSPFYRLRKLVSSLSKTRRSSSMIPVMMTLIDNPPQWSSSKRP